jgi:hypothetical protein
VCAYARRAHDLQHEQMSNAIPRPRGASNRGRDSETDRTGRQHYVDHTQCLNTNPEDWKLQRYEPNPTHAT